MQFAEAIGLVVVVILVALILGWVDVKVKHPAKTWIWVSCTLLLFVVWGFETKDFFGYIGLGILMIVHAVEHIPTWFWDIAAGLFAAWFIHLVFNLIGNSFSELAQELERTNARMTLLEDSMRDKISAIQQRLPEEN